MDIKNSEVVEEPEEDFAGVPVPVKPVTISEDRTVNLILDHSAFIRGIGNVKRWFNKDYIRSQLVGKKGKAKQRIHLNIYIPSYTLHEFEYAKKGSSILSSNAREALKFIDQIFENELEQPSFGSNFVENFDGDKVDHSSAEYENPLLYNVYIENRTENFPRWDQCLPFQLYTPRVRDFPHHKTKFDSVIWRPGRAENDFDSAPQQEPAQDLDSIAVIPERLKHLIRSCVFKKCGEQKVQASSLEEWKLVTEDAIPKVWAQCFGVDSLNVNEAELLIFHSQDISSFTLKNAGTDFNADTDMYDTGRGILHQWIDTTSYEYKKLGKEEKKSKARNGNKKTKKKRSTLSDRTAEPMNPEEVKSEKFDMINYAPRTKGKLWTPSKKS